jgi:hypothetical protein
LLEKLNRGIGSEKIAISKGLFVEARGPEHLLALLEMHSLQDSQWCHVLRSRLASDYDAKNDGALETVIAQDLEKLIVV